MPGLVGFGPLVGLNDMRFGPRFVSVHDAYDADMRWAIENAAFVEYARVAKNNFNRRF